MIKCLSPTAVPLQSPAHPGGLGTGVNTLLIVDFLEAPNIILVMDNLNTHTFGSLYEAFAPAQAS